MITIRTYQCWVPDLGEDRTGAKTFEAVDHEDAACQCVRALERATGDGLTDPDGATATDVCVALPDEPPARYIVIGTLEPQYYATAAKELEGSQS